MRHFPIFVSMRGQRIVVAGGGDAALAKLRLLLKTEAEIAVFSPEPSTGLEGWAADGRIRLHRRALGPGDAKGARLVYAAADDDVEDARVVALAQADGVLVNAVDNLVASDFITPALVDRDPVTVAIGTEGAAPVLARRIKAELEALLPAELGALAEAARGFRARAEALPAGRARRDFWSAWYGGRGEQALARGENLDEALQRLMQDHLARRAEPGRVVFAGAGPGDPELLTLKARRALDEADVVIHDRLVPAPILELARREATIICAGKEGFGPSVPQAEIDALLVRHAAEGALVVRLKSGDPGIFGRLDDEIEACEAAGVAWSVIPGVTSASAAAVALGQSLTRRGRNSGLRLITGHDTRGFAEHDWRSLARPGEVSAIYMGKRSARFVQGRLLMHGADPATPASVVENAGRPGQRIVASSLATLADDLAAADLDGPAITFIGLAPRDAETALPIMEVAQ